jgi:glyoxylate reductase
MTRIYITRKIPEAGIALLRAKGYEVDVNPIDAVPTKADLIAALSAKPYDIVVSLLVDTLDASVFDAAPSVKLYANYAIGYNNIDIAEAKKRGILVTNAPGDYMDCIAEHTFALILGLTTRTIEADDFVRAGKYTGWAPMNFIGIDLKGSILGLVGAGHIGVAVARIAKNGFGMNIIYTDVVRNEELEKEFGAVFISELDVLLPQSDIVSLHVPLLDSTRHLINVDRLKRMKPGAFLINTSRGPVIDERALVEALKTNIIAGAGLDVYENEPTLTPGLAELPNVVLTPHIASASQKARDLMAVTAANNVIDFVEGRVPRNIVNP